tara:strand:+ start:131 stop:703 length:573 start_codon:yes stop_codon:yes gene_type:complete
MMFYGYKDETKDIDILFENEKSRQDFINVLEQLQYSETSPLGIYLPKKAKNKYAPLMYKRDESRFDLFVKKIFQTIISPRMKEDLFSVHEFKSEKTLTVNVLKKEHIVLLKAVTERDKDFEDILTIIKKEKTFDWQYFIDEVVWQFNHGNDWALLDVEKMLLELKKYTFIEKKYFTQLYQAHGKKPQLKK